MKSTFSICFYVKKDKQKANGTYWKSHATLTLLAKQDCPLWLQYD